MPASLAPGLRFPLRPKMRAIPPNLRPRRHLYRIEEDEEYGGLLKISHLDPLCQVLGLSSTGLKNVKMDMALIRALKERAQHCGLANADVRAVREPDSHSAVILVTFTSPPRLSPKLRAFLRLP